MPPHTIMDENGEKKDSRKRSAAIRLAIAIASAACLIVIIVITVKVLASKSEDAVEQAEVTDKPRREGGITYTTDPNRKKQETVTPEVQDFSKKDEGKTEEEIARTPVKVTKDELGSYTGDYPVETPIGEDPVGDNIYDVPLDTYQHEGYFEFVDATHQAIDDISKSMGINNSVLHMLAVDRSCYGQLDPYIKGNNIYQMKDTTGTVKEKKYVYYINLIGKIVNDSGYYKEYDSPYDSVLDFATYIKSISADPGNTMDVLSSLADDGYIGKGELMEYYDLALVYAGNPDYEEKDLFADWEEIDFWEGLD